VKITTLRVRVRRWQHRIGLSDHSVHVLVKDNLRANGRGCNAVIEVIDQRISMTFDTKALSFEKDTLDMLIVHEFEHVIDDAEDEVLIKYLGNLRGNGLVYKEWQAAKEKACDHRAAAIVNAYRRKRDRHSK
jgi:hypothetical protein